MISLAKRIILNKIAFYVSYIKVYPLLQNINQDSLIIDCGANLGDISAIFSGRNAKVIAFEPDPMAYDYLVRRFQENDRITCINHAVSHREGKADFYFHQDRAVYNNSAFTVSSSLIAEKINVDNSNSIAVKTIDLDKYIDSLGQHIDILKLDVEGAEIDILHKLIDNKTYTKVKLILVETHEKKIPGHDKLVTELKRKIEQKGISNIKLNWI